LFGLARSMKAMSVADCSRSRPTGGLNSRSGASAHAGRTPGTLQIVGTPAPGGQHDADIRVPGDGGLKNAPAGEGNP
jgi:hypothetical protein